MKLTVFVGLLILSSFAYESPRPTVPGEQCQNSVKTFKSKQTKPIVSGIVLDCETGEPMVVTALVVNDTVTILERTGTFTRTTRTGQQKITTAFPGFIIEHVDVNLRETDSLYITFYCKQDTTPIRCPEVELPKHKP